MASEANDRNVHVKLPSAEGLESSKRYNCGEDPMLLFWYVTVILRKNNFPNFCLASEEDWVNGRLRQFYGSTKAKTWKAYDGKTNHKRTNTGHKKNIAYQNRVEGYVLCILAGYAVMKAAWVLTLQVCNLTENSRWAVLLVAVCWTPK